MRIRGLIAALLIAGFAGSGHALEAIRAVGVPVGTVYGTGQISDADLVPVGGSAQGLLCLWYKASGIPQGQQQATLISAHLNSELIFMAAIVRTATGPKIELFFADEFHHWAQYVSTLNAPLDGTTWHFIGDTWSFALNNHENRGVVDTLETGWTAESSSQATLSIPWGIVNNWLLFADQSSGGGYFGYFGGAAAQWYLHVGQSDYYSILNPNRHLPGCAMKTGFFYKEFRPMEYGPGGSGPFGPIQVPGTDFLPLLHLSGTVGSGEGSFSYNQGGSTSFKLLQGFALFIPTDDPFRGTTVTPTASKLQMIGVER